jgi:ubiquinone/menaquinone biosynthesis C-methylase UbiE
MESSFDKNWDDYAKLIYERKISDEWAVLRKARESHWDEFFNVKEGDKLLDAGCGLGEYTIFSLRNNAKVWAFDYSVEMVNLTSELVERESLKAEKLSVDSITAIPYEDNFFDQVFCLAVLDHVNDESRLKGIIELKRVVKKGGRIVIDVPNRYAYHWRFVFYLMRIIKLYPKGNIHFFTPSEINQLLSENGFKRVKTLGLTILPPFSGIYTTSIQRLTFLPEFIIKPLDKLYLMIEISLRRISLFKPICWHYFIEAEKL